MAATAAQQPIPQTALPTNGNKPKHISWDNFEKRYLSREDGYKYEWVRGLVIKSKNTMNQKQLYILANLRDFFNQLVFTGQIEGYLEPEVDTFFIKGEAHRRPDLSFFTKRQQALAAHGLEQVPQFVIEVISSNDLLNDLEDKLMDYWRAGVQVVWLVYPKQEVVYVHCLGKEATRCQGESICSATPVLPLFAIAAVEIFKKPPMPM
ncbi:MAG: Uma2 family endonuclease [Saprospiraceae bacterium]|jgi:Uma2 family endonuclease|nr:Uma2 family endonuclease [Saprospiraceae bacterium]